MRIPGPGDLLRAAGHGYESLDRAIELVPRLVALVSEVDTLMRRVTAVVSGIEATQRRAAEAVERTEVVVTRAAGLSERIEPLLDAFGPTLTKMAPSLEKLEPLLARLAETTSPHEIDAVVRLVDSLPGIVDKLDADILPVIDTLATVAPDLRDLLDVSRELNALIGNVPGLGRIKRRIEAEQEAQAEEDAQAEYRATEEPPPAPARRHSEETGTADVVPTDPAARGTDSPLTVAPLTPNASAMR